MPIDPAPEPLLPDASRRRLSLGLGLGAVLALGALAGCKPEVAESAAGLGEARAAAPPASAPEFAEVSVPSRLFEAHDLDWQDLARQRPVPVRLYLPAESAGAAESTGSAAGLPLLLFSHGLGGSRRGYSYLGAYLASQGVASLHVQHVGSDRGLWTGNPFSLVGRLQDAAKESEALNRVADVRFALDQLLASEFGERIDPQRIAAAGHSYGANTTMLLAGARVQRQGQVLPLLEPRIKAAILISAPPFYGESDLAPILQDVRIPSLHITATQDVIQVPGYYSAAEDRIKVFEAMGGPSKALAMFEGGSHSIFTDRSGTGGVSLNPKVKVATRELSLAFLDHVFVGRKEGLSRWNARYGALLQRWQPAAGMA
ncbi:alpha/beta hydrolase family protein [Paucibacter sp. B51]|uniref:alpha/beta hydrolase family protein n=1 Tax=Paucibacter sp. B51 TaxID=2993315 RepID=UPI0022EBE039|nr:alpha/beta fold hydrolase [Paucibacter sp. B51]